jgi:hypothetical protein
LGHAAARVPEFKFNHNPHRIEEVLKFTGLMGAPGVINGREAHGVYWALFIRYHSIYNPKILVRFEALPYGTWGMIFFFLTYLDYTCNRCHWDLTVHINILEVESYPERGDNLDSVSHTTA